MRGLILDFQVELMKNKAALLPIYEATALQAMNCVLQGQVPIEQIYDLNVLEFAVQSWQYQMVSFPTCPFSFIRPRPTVPVSPPCRRRCGAKPSVC